MSDVRSAYHKWWHNEGSGMAPLPGQDWEEHMHTVTEIAWLNGAYVARSILQSQLPTNEKLEKLYYEYSVPDDDGCEILLLPDFQDAVKEILVGYGQSIVKPVPIAERLPEPGQKVLAHYRNSLGNGRTVIAEYVREKSKSDDGDLDSYDFLEYDEESDKYYWPEGWYELIENWEEFGAVQIYGGEVTHWQPLPAGPNYTPSIPKQEAK